MAEEMEERKTNDLGVLYTPSPLRLGCAQVDSNAPVIETTIVKKHTVWESFDKMVKRNGQSIALNVGYSGTWRSYTWSQYQEEALGFASGLLHLGFRRHETVIIAANNSPNTLFATLGTFAAGGIVSHARLDCHEEHLIQMARNSNATVFVVQDIPGMLKVLRVPLEVPDQIRAVIVLDNSLATPPECSFAIYNLVHFQALGQERQTELSDRIAAIEPTDPAILVYQFSTKGMLRGALLIHDTVMFTANALAMEMGPLGTTDRMVGYLPLFHVAAQIFEIFMPISCGVQLFYASNAHESLGETLKHIEPTIFGATPSTWSHIASKLFREKSKLSHSKTIFYKWAKNRAKSNSRKLQYGSGTGTNSVGHVLANHMVLKGIKQKLGLARCRACYALMAPLSLQLLEEFNAMDIPIYQTQGSIETCGFATLNGPRAWVFGSYGKPLVGTQLHVNMETSEVFYHGRHIFAGYYLDEAATRSRVDAGGWLHSSQLGHLNPDGFLLVTEYLSNYVVLSTGDVVPPLPYEKALLKDMPELKQALVVGDSRSYLIALLIIRTRSGSGLSELDTSVVYKSRDIGSKATTLKELIRDPLWSIRFDHALERLNDNAQLASHKIRKWSVLTSEFTIEGGELDEMTREPHRAFIQRKYKSLLDSLYS